MTKGLHDRWTIKEVLRWTTDYFKQKEIDAPRLTAELLLARVLKTNRLHLYLNYDQPLTPPELAAFKGLIKRRLAHEPLAYILGEHPFWSLSFKVTPATLIPRPETELVVETGLNIIRDKNISAPYILDWGTGSGIIAICLAKEIPLAKIFATDISLNALKVAWENIRRHQVEVHLLQSPDLTIFKPGSFDLILSNPPYIKTAVISTLAPEVKDYEPRSALDGGEDGLKYIRYLLKHTPTYLKTEGWLVMEIGYDQKEAVEEIVSSLSCWLPPAFFKDHAGHNRVVAVKKKHG
ncbi:MAG: peptide chain release factor N(5)-glutamine methyltransferase [Candidatus Desulfofervidaceae bacterium]|nr:peptide chain release factor N(5)-glutamine methyltransferase [Candidatus Desulfofervidaceae bacterium]